MCGNGKNLPDRECMVQQDYEVDIEDAYEPDKVANHPGAGEGGGEITLFVGTSIMYVAMVRSCQTESIWYNRITRPTKKMLVNLTLLYSPIEKFLRKKTTEVGKKSFIGFFLIRVFAFLLCLRKGCHNIRSFTA